MKHSKMVLPEIQLLIKTNFNLLSQTKRAHCIPLQLQADRPCAMQLNTMVFGITSTCKPFLFDYTFISTASNSILASSEPGARKNETIFTVVPTPIESLGFQQITQFN